MNVDAWLARPPIDDTDGVRAAREYLTWCRQPLATRTPLELPFTVSCRGPNDERYYLGVVTRDGLLWIQTTPPFTSLDTHRIRVDDILTLSEFARHPRTVP